MSFYLSYTEDAFLRETDTILYFDDGFLYDGLDAIKSQSKIV